MNARGFDEFAVLVLAVDEEAFAVGDWPADATVGAAKGVEAAGGQGEARPTVAEELDDEDDRAESDWYSLASARRLSPQ
ncbi:hypothetical protein ACIRSJ_12405 [Streptomyces virginiae]|uniref:hypothetical protein n=1 Tax=Streptomyces virginiae TaxID=1961 RepID=UPI00381E3F56